MLSNKSQKGFSLIELMVAVSIFAIVMLIGVGAILAIVNGNKKNQSMQIAINNLNYAIENITRLMKTGNSFALDNGIGICGAPSTSSITFNTVDGENVTVRLQDDSLYYDENSANGYSAPITAPEIEISKLCFTVVDDEDTQPAIIMLIQGVAYGNREDVSTDFSIHTSVTQRSVDY
jgi:prepilin-type N-terminal cleavage/methylation domain-containing protein